ncbi:MAG: LL-diaminopimelate aminotransferase [Gloeomargarita sp. DG02_5_bins_242]
MVRLAERLAPLAQNVFADVDQAKAQVMAQGMDVIDLSLGSSDLPTRPEILAVIREALQDQRTHGYLLFHGTREFRRAAAAWYERRYGVAVDPETEVLPLIGSQEGTAHLPLAVLNPGDYGILLDPGYPSHAGGVALAGGQMYLLRLRAEQGFLPDFGQIPPSVLARARLLVLSYPHNPTTAVADLAVMAAAVDFCRRHDLVLCHDFPYADLVFGDRLPPSVLQADRDKRVSVEFFSMSKSYNMGGFRLGYAIGNPELILALRRVKAAVDFNQYGGILRAGAQALMGEQTGVREMVQTFRERRDAFVAALHRMGWSVPLPPATMYVWAPLPAAWQGNSLGFCQHLVQKTGVAACPGVGFGPGGEGYVRFALVHPPARLQEAVNRMAAWLGMG